MTKEYQTEVWLTDLGHGDLSCPFVSESGLLHVVTSGSGEVHEISKNGQMRKIHGTGGQLSGATFQNNVIYMADFAHGAVVSNEGGRSTVGGWGLRGPSFEGTA